MGLSGKLAALTAAGLLLTGLPALAAGDLPRTGFEKTGGARWTTAAEEQQLLGQLGRKVNVDKIGTTTQGRPIHLVKVGQGGPTIVLFLCSQHGDEPAGREACLIKIRDLAYDKDSVPAGTTLLFVPNANPDGREADTRGNADGVDINRDHIALETPEGRTFARVIRDHQPDVVHDLHEFGPRPLVYDKDVLWLWPRNLNVHKKVHDESEVLSRSYVRPAVESRGLSSGVYGFLIDPVTGQPTEQIAGDGQERILRNTTGLKHALGLLVETNTDPNPGEDVPAAARRRVASHLYGVSGTLKLVQQRRVQLETATSVSRSTAPSSRDPIFFGGADNQAPPAGKVEPNPPCGYRLTSAQYAQVAEKLALHGVDSRRSGDGRLVPLAQQARSLIPLLLDKRADFELVAGTPVARC
ncbi:M14 family metallocarboxypeptidase [Kibdelosporangium philippinense]|uniref:M14 family metallocarboxypeptidase n=1 Tax=Kibdelosporangium philippinense TaxID=211113 RepID=A0ABS8ZW24_9PSEU|nr:M14 family metallocarboxypeptidase [Kibdelosporangium philippinense]MCE7011901.1 M14 family metallocarboxypeptidase [Kibdelosporangium philippinense]